MTLSTYERYLSILEDLGRTHPEYAVEKFEALKDELQSLPGFPHSSDEDPIYIPVLNTNQPVVVMNVPIH